MNSRIYALGKVLEKELDEELNKEIRELRDAHYKELATKLSSLYGDQFKAFAERHNMEYVYLCAWREEVSFRVCIPLPNGTEHSYMMEIAMGTMVEMARKGKGL